MKKSLEKGLLSLYDRYGEIKIKCRGSGELPIDKIVEFQGDLKTLTDKNLLKLAKLIFRLGFIAPFFIWDSGGEFPLLDGHERLKTILSIREAGIPIPGLFPVVFIEAESEEQAREFLLSITSQAGEFEKTVLSDWVGLLDEEIAESLRVVDKEIKLEFPSLLDTPPEFNPEEDDLNPSEKVKLTISGITREKAKEIFNDFIDLGYEVSIK